MSVSQRREENRIAHEREGGKIRSVSRMIATMQIRLRLAVAEDIPVLRELIEASVRGLQTEDYTPAQIEGALKTVFGVDSRLIEDGTYIVAEAANERSNWMLV